MKLNFEVDCTKSVAKLLVILVQCAHCTVGCTSIKRKTDIADGSQAHKSCEPVVVLLKWLLLGFRISMV